MTKKKKYNCPEISRMLLKLMSVYHEKYSIIEDFDETFSKIVKSEPKYTGFFGLFMVTGQRKH